MGVSSHAYLGPYFRCKTRTVQVQAMITTCSNATCSQHGVRFYLGAFCGRCGSVIVSDFPVEVTATEPGSSEISEAIREALYEVTRQDADFGKGFHLWVPNVRRPGQPERPNCDSRCGVEVPVDGLDIEAEKRWLATAFAIEGAKLIEAYGGADVAIRWGLLKYCS